MFDLASIMNSGLHMYVEKSVLFISGKCKRLPRQLVELSLTKKITKFAEVIARSKCGIFTEILDITTT